MTISLDRVRELIQDHDERPMPELGGLNFYVTFMKIALENEGTTLPTWDYAYTQERRNIAMARAGELIALALSTEGTGEE